MTEPACDSSHIMCWPQTGQANLNSLIATVPTIPYTAGEDNAFLQPERRLAVGLECSGHQGFWVSQSRVQLGAPQGQRAAFSQ